MSSKKELKKYLVGKGFKVKSVMGGGKYDIGIVTTHRSPAIRKKLMDEASKKSGKDVWLF